jgi:Ni/Fe-hydrogenase 1 B-type cytochrome subunit
MLKESVYVWESPIRIYHWVNVVLLVVLVATGLFIGHPIFTRPGEAGAVFIMGKVRLWHSMAAWLFIANFIYRFYWAFAGNEWAKFKPWRKGFLADGLESIKYYLFLKQEHTLHTGHNVVAQLSYFAVMWIGSLFMILSGLALQGEIFPGGFQERIAGWMIPLFGGGSYALRSYHHLTTWLFIAFVIVHLYLVIRQDILDDDATVSSIINGHKFVMKEGKPNHDQA